MGSSMLFDDVVTKHVGEMGRGQVLMLLAASCSWASMAMIVLDMVFTTQKPAWTCSHPADEQCAAVLSSGSGVCSLSPQQYTWATPYSSLVSSFGLVCSDSWKVGLVNAMFFVGYWVGSCMFGWLADAYGRKRCLLLSNATSAAAALLCAGSRSYRQYVLGRAVQGFCAAGLPIASYVLSTEAVGPAYRGRAGTASQMVYHAGELLLPLLAFRLQDWRLLNLSAAGICCCTGALLLPLPESPRWLLLRGRHQEARSALTWLAALNGRQLPEDLDITRVVEAPATAAAAEAGAPAEISVAAADVRLATCPADASPNGTACTGGLSSRSSSGRVGLQQQCAEDVGHFGTDAGRVGLSGARLAASLTTCSSSPGRSSNGVAADNDIEDMALDSDCTALLAGPDSAAGQAKQEVKQAQQQHHHEKTTEHVVAQRSSGMLSLFRHALLARFFLVTALLCTVMATCFYTISLATDSLQGSLYMNFFLTSLGELPAALLAGAAIDSIGRRVTVGTGVLLTGLACCACSLLPPGWLATAFASAAKACSGGTWTIAYVYAAEIFPTYIRSVALAGTNQASRLGGIVAPGILYASEQLALPAAAPFAVVGAAALLTAACLGMLPETMGQPQPDSLADLDRLYCKQQTSRTTTSSSSSSSSSSLDTPAAGMERLNKAKGWASAAAGVQRAGAAGRPERGWVQQCVSRQGSKLQRLLSQLSSVSGSAGSTGRCSSGGWAIAAGGTRCSSSNGSYEGGASWQAVRTEEEAAGQQQERHSRTPAAVGVLNATGSCAANEAAEFSNMEMGVRASTQLGNRL